MPHRKKKVDDLKQQLISYFNGVLPRKIGYTEAPEDQIHPTDKFSTMLEELCDAVTIYTLNKYKQ